MKRRVGYSCGHVVEEPVSPEDIAFAEALTGVKFDLDYKGFPVLDKPCGKCAFEERAKTHHHGAGTAGCEACIKAMLKPCEECEGQHKNIPPFDPRCALDAVKEKGE